MNAEAARCFRRACQAENPLDQTIFIGLRQAWLGLALQVQQRATEQPRLVMPAATYQPRRADAERKRKRIKRSDATSGRTGQKSSRAHRRKLAA
jgi:hypothetical protein